MRAELTTSTGIKKAQEVEPVKSLKDLQRIKQYLLGKVDKRDYLLFVLGINIGLRASELTIKLVHIEENNPKE